MRCVFGVAMGLMVLIGGASQARANLVTNGDFEAGAGMPGWTPVDSGAESGSFHGFTGHNGSTWFAAMSLSTSTGSISQTGSDTAGQNYTLNLYMGSSGGPGDFQILWNGVTVYDNSNVTDTSATYNLVSVTGLLGTGSDTLELLSNTPGFIMVDDVSLTPAGPAAAPEPGSFALIGVAGINLAGYFGLRRKRAASAA